MFDSISDHKELSQSLNQVIASYFNEFHREKCYLGLQFRQGKREMIQINVPAGDLYKLLQAKHSDNNDPDSGKNRPEVEGHTDELKEYITKRLQKDKPWILGTLTANISPEKIKVVKLARELCLVVIPRGVKLLAWGQKLSIQGRASLSGRGVEEDRRVNQRVLNFPIAENPIFSLAIAKTYIPHFKM